MMTLGSITLLPWQEQSVPVIKAALGKHSAALDCSDLGTGKTYTAAFVAESVCDKDKRICVVCPKAVIPAWERVFEAMGLPRDRYVVINYEALRRGVVGIGTWEPGGKCFRFDGTIGFICFDEAHKLRSPDMTLNARMSVGATLAKVEQLFMSATLAESPAHLRTIGFALKLHNGVHFAKWAQNMGCTFDPWGKLTLRRTQASSVMRSLNSMLFPDYGVRIRKSDIPGFPDNEILAEAYDFNDSGGIQKAYESMEEELAELEEKEAADGKRVKDAAKAMVAQLRARQRIELLKAPGVAAMAEDAVDEGQSVVIFCNFVATLESLMSMLRKHKPAVVVGGQSTQERQGNIDRFQADTTRVIVVQIASGGAGTSLHDTHGNHPRLSLIFPCYSASDLRQATGRIHRAGAKTKAVQKILFAAGSVEELVMNKLKIKLADMDTLNDGDMLSSERQTPNQEEETEVPDNEEEDNGYL